jgi:hypothetical protein
MYRIKPYSFAQAKKHGVTVRPSTRKGKKIDVFRDGKKVATIGALGMGDYPTFVEEEKKGKRPVGFAESRRKAYKSRHAKNRTRLHSNGWFADKILW